MRTNCTTQPAFPRGLEQAAALPLPGGGQEAGTLMLRDKIAMVALWAFIAVAAVVMLQGCGVAFMYCGLERQNGKVPIGCDW